MCVGDARGTPGSRPGQQQGQERRLAQTWPPRAPHSRTALALRGKGHSFARADSARTRGLCGLLLLTKAELKRTCE